MSVDDTVQTAWPIRISGRAAAMVVVALLVLVLAVDLGERATLVDPIPFALKFIAGAIGFGSGCWLSFQLMHAPSPMDGLRRTLGLLGLPVFALVMGTFLARAAVEALAFAGLAPVSSPIEAQVIS